MNKRLKTVILAIATVIATFVTAGPAQAATVRTTCSNHSTQATLYTASAWTGICFQGKGTWYGYIPSVSAVWSGPYTVAIGMKGTENPIIVRPFTKRSFSPVNIEFVNLY